MSNPLTFRAWLRQRRQERGLTQEELGELVGYAAQTITKIEGGQRRPSLQLALRLAEVLQIATADHPAWMAAARADDEAEQLTPQPPAAATEPLRPPTPSPGLPAYLTPFVGRAEEQDALAALLARPDSRLVTLLGPGGAGKTRLAIETARALRGFEDGITFVSLAPLAAPEAIVPAVAEALGLAFAGALDLTAQLIAYLRERRALLILDNVEHLIDPAGQTLGLLERLLAEAPRTSVLATSRERLRIAGEWVLELGGLAVAQPRRAARTGGGPALALFVEHAERVDRAFRLTTEHEETVATICRLVDGLPLGIELAAAWTRLLSLDEIAQELARGLDTMHLSPGRLPARHHSLRSVVDHSWQLLNAEERAALRRLAVFQGGFTREAAAQVAEAPLPLLANLADKSLLRRGGTGIYDLHEVIRQYADARLREQPDEYSAVRTRHAAFYLRLVAAREWRLKGAEQGPAVAEIVAEIANVRAAWVWAASHGMLDALERAGEVLQWFYEFRGWFQEGNTVFAQALEELRRSGTATATPAGRRTLGRLLSNYGYLTTRIGDFATAQAVLAESYALLADGADPIGLGRTLYTQAAAARWCGEYDEARSLLERSLALTATTGDHHVRATSLTVASNVAHEVGAFEEAERLFRAALADWRVLENPRGAVWCITSCSHTLMVLGKYEEAQQLLRESLTLSHAADDRYGTAATLYRLGLVAFQQDDLETAIYFLRETLPLLNSASSWEYLQVLNALGAALWRAGSKDEAWRTFGQALAKAVQMKVTREVPNTLVGLATHLADGRKYAAALALATRVLADPASPEEARRDAAEIQQAARSQLPADEAARIEAQAGTRALTTILAELGLATITR